MVSFHPPYFLIGPKNRTFFGKICIYFHDILYIEAEVRCKKSLEFSFCFKFSDFSGFGRNSKSWIRSHTIQFHLKILYQM